MRAQAKGNAPYGQGISAASCYDAGIKSAATDIEALIDRYGPDALHAMIDRIYLDMREYGDSIYNREYNIKLSSLPYARLKKGRSKAEQNSLRKMLQAKRKELDSLQGELFADDTSEKRAA
jgi:hypothetical protein